MSKARRDLQACRDIIRSVKQDERRTAENLAGPFLEQMLHSLPAAESLLANPDAKVRLAALLILRQNWKPVNFRQICENLALKDPDEQVRDVAVISLGRFYHGTNDADVGRFVANLVHDPSRTTRMRIMPARPCARFVTCRWIAGPLFRKHSRSRTTWTGLS